MIYTQEDESILSGPDDKVFIYPFANDPSFHDNRLIVRPGSVQLDLERMIINVEYVQLLVDALLHSIEIARRSDR